MVMGVYYSVMVASLSTTSGVLNVLTGVFVNVAIQAAHEDRTTAIQSELEEKNSWTSKIRVLFQSVDKDGSGSITATEFERLLKNEEMMAYFNALEIDMCEAQGLFELLDTDLSGDVSIDEFVNGCLRLKGEATAVDVVTMIHQHKKLSLKMNHLDEIAEQGIGKLHSQVGDLTKYVEEGFSTGIAQRQAMEHNFRRMDSQVQNLQSTVDQLFHV